MFHFNRKKFALQILSIIFLFFFMPVLVVFAAGATDALTGLNSAAQMGYTGEIEGNLNDAGIVLSLPAAIGKAIGAGLSLIGVAFLILMIYGGFIWMIARGNESEITKAKDLIYSAVIGLVIVLAAYAITKYVSEQLL